MKIAIICHFTNEEIQDKIKPWKRINEFAPWISYYIEEFKKFPEHEFYIISPHQWLLKNVKYSENNIHYYFFRWGMPIIGRRWPGKLNIDFLTKYWLNKLKVRKYINSIKPDVINLFGAENPYYSSTLLQFKEIYPVLITIQGFVNNARLTTSLSKYMKYRLDLEREIISTFDNYCIRTDDMLKQIKQINPKVIAFRFGFPIDLGKYKVEEIKKEYDFVLFARISKDKGIYDYLNAIKEIKLNMPSVKAMVIGPCNNKVKNETVSYIRSKGLDGNIDFIGFIATQEELYKKVKKAKISVLPTYNDLISGTIIESMFLKIPVVAYRTGSIPEVNKDRENIIICEQGNQKELEQEMLQLLNNEEKQARLAKDGYEWVSNRFDNNKAMKGYFESLSQIIEDFKK